jgi:hypothetical protein
VAGVRIRGWEVALRSPRLCYSSQHAEGEGAVTGGLTDFSPPGGIFLLDHDQHHTLNTGVDANLLGICLIAVHISRMIIYL